MSKFCHELNDFKQLCEAISEEASSSDKTISPALIEKDYWVMHCLWGLQQLGWEFHLKGGTSLSKGWNLLERFSEDIDILIIDHDKKDVPTGRNQNKPNQIQAREEYFSHLVKKIKIPGIDSVKRDTQFQDKELRGTGIRLEYQSQFQRVDGVKEGVLLEVGFDQTSPNLPRPISSWVIDKALSLKLEVRNNQALNVLCYLPEYTFVEKLQAISTKYRKQKESGVFEANHLRHYYDIACLLREKRVQEFIGTKGYIEHKESRFRQSDEPDLTKNDAFALADAETFKFYEKEFSKIENLFYSNKKPRLRDLLNELKPWLGKL